MTKKTFLKNTLAALKQRSGKLFSYTFYTLLIFFLIVYIQKLDFQQFESIDFSWFYLTLATIISLASRYFGAFIWISILKSLGATNISFSPDLVYIYAKSWLGRYIPGTAPWILGKIYFASKHGVSKNKLAVSSLLEAAIQISVTFTLAFLLLIFDTRTSFIDPWLKFTMAITLAICIVSVVPAIFNRVIAFIYKIVKKKVFETEHYASSSTIKRGVGLYLISSITGGLSFFFITKAIYPGVEYHDLFYIVGASSLASAVSMLAVFAPSGIGVREGIQVLLFSAIMPVEIALTIAIITRLWFIIIDLIFFISATAVKKIASKR